MEKTLFWGLAAIVIISSFMLGNWFLKESKRIKAEGKPLYKAYFTTPGILVLIAFSIAIIYYLVSSNP